MHLALSTRRILRGSFAIPVAALIALAGCTMVGDSITGLSMTRLTPSVCIRACVETQTNGVHAEATFHQAQIEACQSMPESQKRECLEAEAARHAAVMAQIAAGRRECMNDCHRQGSGRAGY